MLVSRNSLCSSNQDGFVYDTYDAKSLNTKFEQLVTNINETSTTALKTAKQYSF